MRVAASIDRSFFAPTLPRSLAICRSAVFGWLLVQWALYDVADYAHMPQMLWQPTSFFRLGIPPPTERFLTALGAIYSVSLISSTLGLKTRLSTVVAAIIGLYLWGLPNNFGKIHHAQALPVVLSLVLASSRCGDAFSLDSWRKKYPAPPSGSYNWPVLVGRLAFALAMFSAGLNKVFGGWLSAGPESFQYLFRKSHAISQIKGLVLPDLALDVAAHPEIAMGLCHLALYMELATPLAVVMAGRIRAAIILGLLGMQLANAFVLGIHSSVPWLSAYAFWLPWNTLGPHFPQGMRAVLMGLRDQMRAVLRLPGIHGARLPVSRTTLQIVARSIRHVSGPKRLTLGATDVIVTSVVRNVEETLPEFLGHHRSLGIRHFVLLDTGSTDRTHQIVRDATDVTFLETSLPFGTWVHSFRAYLAERFTAGGWCLQIDADELFDFPFSERIRLGAFISYLDGRRFDAVLANMLEMFSKQAPSESSEGQALRSRYRFFDLENIRRNPLPVAYRVVNPELREYRGGIRSTVFDTNHDMLYKYPLVRFSETLRPWNFQPHQILGSPRVADVSCVLYHYQFTDTLRKRSYEAVRERNYGSFSEKYQHYLETLERHPDISIYDLAIEPDEVSTTAALVERGFLQVSQDYRQWTDSASTISE